MTDDFPAFTTPVRGHAFAGRPPGMVRRLHPGTPAVLVREADNPKDANAVGVWIRGRPGHWRIGYLERAVAIRLAPRLDRGVAMRAELGGWIPDPSGRWQRPTVRISAAEDGLHGHQGSRRQEPLDDCVIDAA